MLVGTNAISTRMTAEKYFAKTICISDTGCVNRISIVPLRCSSANIFIVTAGIRKRNTHGAIMNNGSMLENPLSIILKSAPGKIHMINPNVSRKTIITIYPINELKKLLISFFNSATTFN